MDRERAAKALLAIDLLFGISFVFFPRLTLRLYGLDPDREPSAAYPLRYLGARSFLLAALMASDTGRPVLLRQMPFIAATDATVNLLAMVRRDVPRRVVLLGALSSVVAIGLGFVAGSEEG